MLGLRRGVAVPPDAAIATGLTSVCVCASRHVRWVRTYVRMDIGVSRSETKWINGNGVAGLCKIVK